MATHAGGDPTASGTFPPAATDPGIEEAVTRQQWKWSALAGMASFLDAGSIVALGVSLAIWQDQFGVSSGFVGALAAFGPNAIGAGIGAFLGGRLGDLVGRKRIYQYDLLVYAVGVLVIAFAVNPFMLVLGTVVVGLAVGADVPTSLALVGEFSPSKARGKLLGFSQIAWNSGPVVVLLLGLLLALVDAGTWTPRVLFLVLFVVTVVTYVLRRGIVESARWTAASGAAKAAPTSDPAAQPTSAPVPRRRPGLSPLAQLFRGANLRALVWTGTIYIFWNLAAGTNGIFTPYIVTTLHAGSQAAGVGLSCAGFLLGILGTVFVYMRLADRSHTSRRTMWGIGGIMQVAAFGAYLVLPFTIPVIILNIVLFGLGSALAGEGTYKTCSQELFPTMLRGTAQGLTFGTSRLLLGPWSYVVPILADTGIKPVAALLTLFLLISAVVGYVGMPDTAGKALEDIEDERRSPARGGATAARAA